MEVDSGACKAVMQHSDYKKYFKEFQLKPVNIKIKLVSGTKLRVSGSLHVIVIVDLNVIILDFVKPFVTLLGRAWLDAFQPDWKLHVLGKYVSNANIDECICHLVRQNIKFQQRL